MPHRALIALAVLGGTFGVASAETHVIELYSTSFVPSVVDVVPGDTIRWEYVTGYPHTVTSGPNCLWDGIFFNESLSAPGDVYEWIVPDEAPDAISFFCDPHCGNGMEGLINVGDPGRLVFGLVDIADCYIDMGVNQSTGVAGIWVESNDGHFAFGFEVESGDVDMDFTVSDGNLYMTDASGTTPVSTGIQTLAQGTRFALHGEDGVNFTMQWQDEVGDDGADFIGIECFECSVNINGDMASFRTAAAGSSMAFRGEGSIPMSVIGDVTSPTLTLPAFGEEAEVAIPAGIHYVELNGSSSDDDLAWVVMPMGGDDDGGDDGCTLAADIDGSGQVDVGDLLAVIAAWGSICP